jgi:fructan beta-fructosidase
MGSGSIAGGSGGEYFVGTFDGVRFMPTQEAQWVDFGRDFYAPISFSDIPESDGRRIWLGWMNNWETALQPTSPWRSSMSIPRVLSLRNRNAHDTKLPADYVLIQKPVEELKKLRSMEQPLDTSKAAWPPVAITEKGSLSERSFELELKLNPGEARSCGIRLRSGVDEFLEIGYDRDPGVVYVDRRQAGNVDFHPAFAGRYEAPVRLIDRSVILQIIVDRSTSEVFINDGEAVISNCFFPNESSPVIEVFTGDASASVTDAKLWTLKSIWKP